MEQTKYQGYARERGFNPIQVSTASVDAIAQQGNALSRQLRENQDIERRNRDAFLSQVQQNQNIEGQNRAANRDFERQSQDRYQQAVLQNLRTQVRSAEIQQQNNIETFAALGQFSKTISNIVLEQKKKKDQEAEVAGQNLVFETGITYEDYVKLKADEAKLDASDTQINSVVNRLKAQGYSDEYIARIRNLSGRQLYGASKQWAIQGGENYGSFRAEMADEPFLINGRELTLAEAARGTPEDYAAVNAAVRAEYLKRFQGLNPAFANEYLYEGMRKVEARERLNFSEVRAKELELDRVNKEQNDLLTEWKASKGDGLLGWIQRMSGGDRTELGEKRRTALGYLTAAAKSGAFTSSDLEELEATQFLPNGESKPVLFGERFSSDLVELRSAVRAYNAQLRQDRALELEEEKTQFEQRLTQYVGENGALSKAEVEEAKREWQARGFGAVPSWLKSMETQEELADEQGEEILTQLQADGMLTTRELNSGRYSSRLRVRFMNAAKQQESVDSSIKTNSYSTLDAALKQTLGTVTQGINQNSDFFIAQGEARRLLSQKASELISQGVTPVDAWKQATNDLRTEILQGKQGQGRFALRLQSDGKSVDLKNPGFQLAGQGTNATAQRQRARKVQSLITSNPKALFTQKLLTQAEIEQLESFRTGGGGSIPPIVWAINSRIKNASPFDIIDAQMKAYGRQPLQRPNTARLYDEVRPDFRQLLTWRPSMDRTLRAVEGSMESGAGGAPGNPYASILDLIASKESVTTDRKLNGYDAMNQEGRDGGHTAIGSGTGTNILGRPLTEMTVGQILALGRQGGIHAAGRYQFVHSTLQGLVDRGKASTGELFNVATQDKLAVAYLRERTGQFWSGRASAASYVPGLGQAWIGLQKIPPKQIVTAMETARRNLQGTRIDVTRLKPQVVYRVGGIGPKGPNQFGAHLDIKDVTGAYFDRQALDRFVSFKTSAGLKPVSTGTTVKGGEFGADRWYGTHRGWDYAVPEGTQVVLKNGARVISKRPSDYGDVLTIGLPDGRRFAIIHGKAL